ncbi:TPA: CAP domain-containing protein [Burkholderia cenocepacia]|uniref:CAP domain-containing protein n=1 Tax=Burkholderia latens TaxID=488446 RepID=A0A6H9STR6_9BURK|nr:MULTISPECIES: CAP domain-containing protein [Burkholderia]KAB0644632.1 CAP domain-containing protein [Burkholderia latens]MBG0880401.1 CAP domain-containing protein [Burkholderia sp. 9775_39]MBG0886226.1 CAP domain-containing protein [Burkholderia sp. 9773_38]MBJ9922941.1 CAP domain-containing protein [Burkholderia cenocepacia]UJH78874.1 CAP domain-containing protein [Burkholderia cenocepacia]
MKKITTISLSALAAASLLALAACGGGGDGGSTNTGSTGNNPNPSNPGTPSTTVPGTVDSPQYAAGSAQLAALNMLNQYRTQCGFPALKQNTVLDQAAQAHAKYIGLNNAVTDSEVSGNAGYTGATYADRAVAAGFPVGVIGIGASGANAVFTTNFNATVAGQQFVDSLLGGAYHAVVATFPVDLAGFGESETQTTSGSYTFTESWQSVSMYSAKAQTLQGGPKTFPCDGVTGVPYRGIGEVPTPPSVSSSGWGTPITVMGNLTDVIVLQSASVTGSSGAVAIQVLNSDSDPNKLVGKYQAVAYPTSPLQPNTTYNVTLNGTVNGTAFSRSFSFTTGA